MANKFTILGETGSGKTCYLLGMYYEMSIGVAGYNLAAESEEEDSNLARRYEMLKDKSLGQNRFPDPTDNAQKYTFDLLHSYEWLNDFEWIDYPGGWLDPKLKDPGSKQIAELNKNIEESSTLFICIDGANLVGNNIREKIRKVKTRCARNISPYLGKFNGNLPPIVMLVTKYDMCQYDTSPEEIKEIIENSFENLFMRDNVFVSIIPVSLGATLEDDSYSGDLDPINVHLPILMGVDFALIDTLNYGKSVIENDLAYRNEIKAEIKDEKNSFFLYRWFFGKDTDAMEKTQREVEENINKNSEICRHFKASLNRVNRDLQEVDMIYFGGHWQDQNSIRKMWDKLHSVIKYF